MSYDLSISEYGDLILGGNWDLAGVSGEDLIEQRISIRLKVNRGSWFYDTDGNFGSDLYQVIGKSPDQALAIDARVRDALREMDDISVSEVIAEYDEDGKFMTVTVGYEINPEEDEALLDMPGSLFSTTVTIPVVVGGA